MGLDEMHNLTWSGKYGLRVVMTDWNDKEYVALYNHFRVGTGEDWYIGTTGTGLSSQNWNQSQISSLG